MGFFSFLDSTLFNFALTIYIEVEDLLPFLVDLFKACLYISAHVCIRSECLSAKF